MNLPKISIIIPLYNKESKLFETITSVINQTFLDFELVIVDDGSTDTSFEIASQFSDKRIHLFQQENKGAAAARNLGIEKSKSELIAFLDADDYWFPNHLEELIQLYADFPNCGMYCNRYLTKISDKSTIQNSFFYSFSDDFRGVISDFFQASLINRVAFTSSISVPKQVLLDNNCFNTNVSSGQDLELWTKIAISNSVAISNKITAIYHFDLPNSLAKTPINNKTLMNFAQFQDEEKQNPSLKKFLDVHRLEYALQYRIAGNIKKSDEFLNNVSTKIPIKTKFLLSLPTSILKILLKTKHLLKRFGIDFTVYH